MMMMIIVIICPFSPLDVLCSILWNLHNYYKQFSECVEAKITELRQPIEKELKVKGNLAQTMYLSNQRNSGACNKFKNYLNLSIIVLLATEIPTKSNIFFGKN